MKTAKAGCIALCLLGAPAAADWTFVDTWTDPINGFDTKAAVSTADDGTTLHLYRNPAGRVYALFTLPDDKGDIADEGQVATLTPEGFDTKVIEARTEQGRVVEFAASTGRALRNRLWHGEGTAPAFGTLHDMIEAPSISATFTLKDGGEHAATWSMAASGTPIAQAIGITIEGASAGDEWEDAAAQALLAAMTTCQFPKLDVTCVQKVTACSDKISQDRDIEGFDTCVAAKD
ncbi:hypothetical protein [uncultured Tateyamaria sp.]|uniref:hypothetical protein n=1 Tax=uncultured Tateyamaria sp. TaxID=455651 RepID=UPI0026267553|nr:hypothetical protein [uncultured Tateyamaria sp.]